MTPIGSTQQDLSSRTSCSIYQTLGCWQGSQAYNAIGLKGSGSSVHSFIQAISIGSLQVHYYSEALPTQHGYCVRVHAEAPQATASEGPYMVARARFEPTILQTKGVDSTNEPPRPHNKGNMKCSCIVIVLYREYFPKVIR